MVWITAPKQRNAIRLDHVVATQEQQLMFRLDQQNVVNLGLDLGISGRNCTQQYAQQQPADSPSGNHGPEYTTGNKLGECYLFVSL